MEQFSEQHNSHQVIRFDATYNQDLPEEYQDNPLIAALPQKLTKKDFVTLISHLPKFDETHLRVASHYRMKKVAELFNLVIPTTHYYEVYSIIERMIFNSYLDRNPNIQQTKTNQYSLALHKSLMNKNWKKTSGESFVYTGPSGVGKSTLITRVAQSFPQVLYHREFQGKAYSQAQLVWVKIKIPSDAARRSFALVFLEEVDKCIGTEYAKNNPKASIGIYESLFRTIVSTFKLGCLIVDDLQNLSVAKSGGDEAFLNFLSSLCDDLGVALVLVGTPDCTKELQGTFTSSRRLTSAGDIHRERFSKTDKNWKLLVTKLWSYQYINSPSQISKLLGNERIITDQKLFDEIHKLTAGIPFILSFLFVQAQLMAIDKPNEHGKEMLNISQLRKAYNEGSELIKKAVEDITNNGGSAYRDLITLSEREVSPLKTQYLQDLRCLLESPSLSKKAASGIRKIIENLDGNYILKKKELDLLARAKQRLDYDKIAGSAVIDGECQEVSS